jgi:hypothetical protein
MRDASFARQSAENEMEIRIEMRFLDKTSRLVNLQTAKIFNLRRVSICASFKPAEIFKPTQPLYPQTLSDNEFLCCAMRERLCSLIFDSGST